MTTPHECMRVVHVEAGFRWVCTCGARGHAVVDRDTARRGHIVHKEQRREPVQ